MYNELRTAFQRAIAAGVGYLSQAVGEDGAWLANVYDIRAPLAGYATHSPPFVTGLGTMALAACEHPDAAPVRQRSRTHLNYAMLPGQLWRYADFLPPDTDDTAICSMATAPHPQPLANVDVMAASRDDEGRFLTWLPWEAPVENDEAMLGPESLLHTPDAVVSANVVAYLGDRAETHPAQNWLRRLIVDSPEQIDAALHYYPRTLDLDFAIARANEAQAPVLADLRQPMTERIVVAGTFGDIMRTAQAVTALDQLGAIERADVVLPALQAVLDAQRPDGSWPACLAWVGATGFPFAFESASLTTACCIEALSRVARE